jgi:hypothetical protein
VQIEGKEKNGDLKVTAKFGTVNNTQIETNI